MLTIAAVALVTWAGLFMYVYSVDRRLRELERK